MAIGPDTIPAMDLYARVNILEGRAVRLGRGSLDDVISLDADPINRARGWADMGVDWSISTRPPTAPTGIAP